MTQVKVNILQDRNGQPRFVAMENSRWVEYEPVFGLNGIFSQGGFFDKVGTGISGIFRKKDGNDSFIGSLVRDFTKGVAHKVGEDVIQLEQPATVTVPAEEDPLFNNPGTTHTFNRGNGNNKPPEDDKFNWTPVLIGGGVVLAGSIAWYAMSQKANAA